MDKNEFSKIADVFKDLENDLNIGKGITLGKCPYCGSENVVMTREPNSRAGDVSKNVNFHERKISIAEPGPIYLYKVCRNCGKILQKLEDGRRM